MFIFIFYPYDRNICCFYTAADRAGNIVCGAQSKMKMQGFLFKKNAGKCTKIESFSLSSEVSQLIMVGFICYLKSFQVKKNLRF